MPTIGINALYLIPGGVGGTEVYLRSLLASLASIDTGNQYVVFTNVETGADLIPKAPNFKQVAQFCRATIRPWRLLHEQTILPIACAVHGVDVLLNPGFSAPILRVCPNVSVFHDMQHRRHPEYFRWYELPVWRFLLWASAHSSRRLIAISAATAADLHHFYSLPESRVKVVHHGVDERFRSMPPARRPEKFLLCVSTLHPHKNLARLMRAFAIFHKSHPEFSLVVAGMRGYFATALEGEIVTLGLGKSVTLTGWIPRSDLYDLFRRAWAFVYPSEFEGFGMPVLEALEAGIPTVCSSIAPLREVAGNAAEYFDPHDAEEMARALARVTDNLRLRERLVAAGIERAAEFSWKRCAEETLAVLSECLPKT